MSTADRQLQVWKVQSLSARREPGTYRDCRHMEQRRSRKQANPNLPVYPSLVHLTNLYWYVLMSNSVLTLQIQK